MATLNIDAAQLVKIPLRAVIGESIAVLGIKGSGKTNTAAVLIEELLANGLPLTIVDIEGEYWGLKEKFEVFVVGRSANVDVSADVAQAAAFAEFSLNQGVSLILDLSEFEPDEMHEFLLRYFQALWTVAFKARRPYQVVLEEAHEFVPQSVRTPLKDILTRIALRGRKRGLGIVTISQRSAKVEKDILTQAAILFLHRVVHPIDMKVYQDVVPLPPREVEAKVAALRSGDAIVMVNNEVHQVHLRLRHTFHAGATPELQATPRPNLKRVDSTLMTQLRRIAEQAANNTSNADGRSAQQRLETEVAKRDMQISEQQQTIERLQTQVDLLSKLTLTVEGSVMTVPVKDVEAQQASLSGQTTPLQTFSQAEDDVQIRQRKRFEHLTSDIRQLPRFHRAMLAFLVERDETSFTIPEIARWLRLSESTLENRPPLELLRMGLLTRKGQRGNFRYASAARQQLRVMFPNLNIDHLIESLIQTGK
jgi:uncharacterized protein